KQSDAFEPFVGVGDDAAVCERLATVLNRLRRLGMLSHCLWK
ncbi:hypothetical protein HMPREF9069_00621, partial [Atopobium sp. oral taxon 810 str. F0209]